jgi:enterochelin esterase-like enzyme
MKSHSGGRSVIFLVLTPVLLVAAASGQEPPPHETRPQGAAFMGGPGPGICKGTIWVDPDKSEPAGTRYRLFGTPSRGPNTEGSYLIYLPPDYETAKTRRYPVLYFLHGGGGNQRSGAWLVEKVDGQIRAGALPPFIIVLPQALPDVRFINSKDGTRPLEDVMIKDLIPHVDSTYRTMADRAGRAIEGFSMGGFGSLRLGFKFPNLFGTVSGLAPSITEMKDEPDCIIEPFGPDQAFYDEVGPWNIVKQNAAEIRGRTTVRLLVGDKDRLLPMVTEYHELLTSLGIQHRFAVIGPEVFHRDTDIIGKAPFDALAFWKDVFGNLK